MENNVSEETSNKSIFEYSQENYEELFEKFESEMEFRNHSIEEWLLCIRIKPISEDVSMAELERYTSKISNVTEIIMENFSLAKANFTGLKNSVEIAISSSKIKILEDIDAYNEIQASPAKRKKKPTADVLEALARKDNNQLLHNLAISEMFYAFWESQYKKISMLNQRVTSMNVLKNIESRNS